jgi:membrane-associated phospholipid phosphatase
MNMEERIARIISVVFHPVLIPTYIIAVLLHLNVFFALIIPVDAKWKIIALVFITSALFPILVLYGMYRFRLVGDLMMDNRKDRLYPYIATTIFLFMTYYLVWQINLSPVYYYCLLGAAIVSVVTLLINFSWKISAHTVAMGAAAGAFIGLQLELHINLVWQIALSILISGLVGYARLRTGSHSQAQIYTGYLLGFTVLYLIIRYY